MSGFVDIEIPVVMTTRLANNVTEEKLCVCVVAIVK